MNYDSKAKYHPTPSTIVVGGEGLLNKNKSTDKPLQTRNIYIYCAYELHLIDILINFHVKYIMKKRSDGKPHS